MWRLRHLPLGILCLALSGCAALETNTGRLSSSNPMPAEHLADAQSREQKGFWAGLWGDYKQMYTPDTWCKMWVGLAVACTLANTSADQDVGDWYQRSVRNSSTDSFSHFTKTFGDQWYPVALYSAITLLHRWPEDDDGLGRFGEWGERSLRGLAVGGPLVGAVQVITGGSRPTEYGSEWRPFHDAHGASGHTFVGATGFLTAAQMVDNMPLKVGLYAGSFLCGFSRINDDAHYISQVGLGWLIAYLSVSSVSRNLSGYTIAPNGVAYTVHF